MRQFSLLEPALPAGMQYTPDFISPDEEAALLEVIGTLPLQEAKYREYTAKRRTVNYGAGYDFSAQRTVAAPPLPNFLDSVLRRAAILAHVEPSEFVQALISEYQPGTPLGWHRDVPEYESIVGISLAGPGRLRFRPYPWSREKKPQVFALELDPRSAYVLRGDARWKWQHSVPPAKQLRYSITLRTPRDGAPLKSIVSP